MTYRQLQEHDHKCCHGKHASSKHHGAREHGCEREHRAKHEDRDSHDAHGQCCGHRHEGREAHGFHQQGERRHGHGHARHCEIRREGHEHRHGHDRCEMHGRGGNRGGRGGHGGGGGEGRGGNFNPLDGHRRIGADELQLIVLALLEEKPRHGYDIIKHLGTLTQGFYAPSPGMIYPVLTYLEESDFVSMTMQGNKKCYELTEQGLAYLNESREHVQAVMGRLTQTGQHMHRMQQSYAEEISASLNNDSMHQAVRALRTALHEKHSATDAEKERIREILMRALKEITG